MNLFAYGSLILPEVWRAVTGRHHASTPGSIDGYLRRTICGATFPGIIATGRRGDIVRGTIYFDVDQASLRELDHFESDFYARLTVTATRADDHQAVPCEAYIVPCESAHLLSASEWDLETFTSRHLKSFLEQNFR